MADIRIKQHIKTTSDGDDVSMVTSFHSAAPRDFVERAIEEVETLGVFAKPYLYDADVDAFFVTVKSTDNRGEYRVETVSTFIKQRIKAVMEAAGSQQPPNHHGDREAHAELG